jgi:protein-L-isoaspartate O-methyltransferase
LDVISTVQPKKWPVCRLELIHQERGRVFEIGTGTGCLDAAFNAVAQLIGVTAPVKALEVDFECAEADALPQVTVEIEIEVNHGTWRGRARTGDLMLSAVGAYLDAVVRALDHVQNLTGPIPRT